MAKKKINIKSVSNDVESGDVNISYNNVRIAGLSETVTAVLETKDTVCIDDIEVAYTKQAGGEVNASFNIPELEDVTITVTNQKLLYSPGEFCKIRIRNRSGDTITARITISATTDNPEIYNTSEIQTSIGNNTTYEYSYFTPNTNFSVTVVI